MKNIDFIISNLDSKENKDYQINQIVREYQPFIINTISCLKNEYIQVENDEEFSIGLLAFAEAIDRYDMSKGSFLSFSKLVITSRIKNYWKKEKKYVYHSIDNDLNNYIDDEGYQEDKDLSEEIMLFEKELFKFGICFEDLIAASPKHKDTREKAVDIAEKTSNEEDLVDFIFLKKRLPITKISRRFFVSLKIIKKSKLYITAIVIVIVKKYTSILTWIKDIKKNANKSF